MAASGKLSVLEKMLVKLRKEGHRLLIFSQVASLFCCVVWEGASFIGT